MSLLIKKILNKIKDLDAKEKINELNVNDILQNGWVQHFYNKIYKKDNIVYLNLAVKSGTAVKVATLPERLQTKHANFYCSNKHRQFKRRGNKCYTQRSWRIKLL